MAQVKLEQVSKVYPGNVQAVAPMDLHIAHGELTVLVGPSGCGKSTTLRMIAGLEEATTGRIFIGDRMVNDVEPRDRNIADTARYIEMVDTLGHATGDSELLDDEALRLERLALLLRTDMGIPLDLLDAAGRTRAGVLVEEGLAEFPDSATLRLCGRGRSLVDPIAAELA